MSTSGKSNGSGGCDCNKNGGADAPVGDSGGLHPGGGGTVDGFSGNTGPSCLDFSKISEQIKKALKSQCGFNDDCASEMADKAAKKVCDAIRDAAEQANVPDTHKDPVTGEEKPGCQFKATINGTVNVDGECDKRTGKPKNVTTDVPSIDISHDCDKGPNYPDPYPPPFDPPPPPPQPDPFG